MNQADKYLQALVDRNKTPCVTYHLFHRDNIIYQFNGGLADAGKGRIVNNRTNFNAFSVTKTFTALAILQLAEQNKLDVDQPAKYFLSEFPYSANITIRHLLTHSAGLPNPIPLSWIHLADEHASFNRNEFFKSILARHYKTKSSPNEKFAYSNIGYFLLGRIIESVSGVSYEEYITGKIIRPLGLLPNELDFVINDSNEHAKGYIKQMSLTNLLLKFFINKSKYMARSERGWKPFNSYYVNGTSYGGLIGTPHAFVKYIGELIRPDCKLISDHYKKILFTENFTTNNKATGMCMSWFTGTLDGKHYFAHAGGGGGYYCEIRIYPDLEMGSVIMFNRTGMSDERFLNMVDNFFIHKN